MRMVLSILAFLLPGFGSTFQPESALWFPVSLLIWAGGFGVFRQNLGNKTPKDEGECLHQPANVVCLPPNVSIGGPAREQAFLGLAVLRALVPLCFALLLLHWL